MSRALPKSPRTQWSRDAEDAADVDAEDAAEEVIYAYAISFAFSLYWFSLDGWEVCHM